MAAGSDTERTARVKFDGTTAGLARAAREAERELKRVAAAEKEAARQALAAEKELAQQRAAVAKEQAAIAAQVTAGVDSIGRGLTSVSSGILKVGGLVGSAQGLAGAASSVGALSGALLVVPAVATAGAIGMATLQLATDGVSEALAAKTPEEWAKATESMADSAVAATVAIRDQRDEFAQLKQTVQGDFFEGLDDDVRALAGTYLPLLETGLGGVATELNGMAKAGADALLAPSAVEDVNQVLAGTQDLFAELRPAVGNVLSGVLDLSAVGSTRLAGLGKTVTGLTEKFEDWVAAGVESGRINELIDEGIETGQQLGRVMVNLTQVGGKLWEGLSEGGGDFLDTLVEGTQAIEDFLDSAEGQEAIRELGETLGVVADVAREVLATALREVAPLVTELGPITREVATAFGEALVNAIETVGPLLTGIAGFLSDNKAVIGELIPLLIGLVVAYKGLQVASEVKGWMSGLPGMLDDVGRSAGSASDKIGDAGGKGLVGRLGGLKAIGAAGALAGVAVGLDEINTSVAESDPEKLGYVEDQLHNIVGAGKEIVSLNFGGIFQEITDEWDQLARKFQSGESPIGAMVGDYDRWIRNVNITPIKFAVNTDPARQDVEQLLLEVNESAASVNINGNDNGAGFALRGILDAISKGKESVTIDGQAIPADVALQLVIGRINRGSGTVNINGNDVPVGVALAGMLQTINGSSGTVKIGADDSNAQGVVNTLVQSINGRTATILVNAAGDRGGLASAGRLATGGRPFFSGVVSGPGTGTNDRAGIFALSDGEHVWTDAEVRAAGGHAAVMRMRRAVLGGALPGLAGGGPAVPTYLSGGGIPVQLSSAPPITVDGASVDVAVYIDGQEFRGMIRTEVNNNNRSSRRAVGAGAGNGW